MSWQEFYKAIQEAYHIEDEETVVKLPFENIVSVNNGILTYKNINGEVEMIDLDNCVKNFNSVLGYTPKTRAGEVVRVVGGRCSLKPVPFFEFFTDTHHTRFCMYLKQTPFRKILTKIGWNAYTKEFSEFYSLQKKLNSVGYSAVDLT